VATETRERENVAEKAVLGLYRLFKLALIHDLKNEALTRASAEIVAQLTRTMEALDSDLEVVFAEDCVFVGGRLLKSSRAGYDSSIELGERLAEVGFNLISVRRGVAEPDIRKTLWAFKALVNGDSRTVHSQSDRFSLRHSSASVRFSGDDDLSVERQLANTYSYAVVAMRRFFEELKEGRYVFTRYVKRLVQRLVMLADQEPVSFASLASMRTDHNDEATRAVNSAVASIAVARTLSRDLSFLSRVGMAAMLFDAGLPRASDMPPKNRRASDAIPKMNRRQQRRVPASLALVNAALGRLRGDGVYRTVIGFESQWISRHDLLGDLYDGAAGPAVESVIVAIVRRFIGLMTYDVWEHRALSIDEAIVLMSRDCLDDLERVVIDLLLSALGVFPRGSIVKLSSGWDAVVTQTPHQPTLYRRPQVYLVVDPDGHPRVPRQVDLAACLTSDAEDFGEVVDKLRRGDPSLLAVREQVSAQTVHRLAEDELDDAFADIGSDLEEEELAPIPASPITGQPVTFQPVPSKLGVPDFRRPTYEHAPVGREEAVGDTAGELMMALAHSRDNTPVNDPGTEAYRHAQSVSGAYEKGFEGRSPEGGRDKDATPQTLVATPSASGLERLTGQAEEFEPHATGDQLPISSPPDTDQPGKMPKPPSTNEVVEIPRPADTERDAVGSDAPESEAPDEGSEPARRSAQSEVFYYATTDLADDEEPAVNPSTLSNRALPEEAPD